MAQSKEPVSHNFIEFGDSKQLEVSNVDIEGELISRHSGTLVRKLDMTLMPIIWLMYLSNYMDRNNISQAKLDGFEKDLHLTGDQFNTAVSILNVGYLLMQLPSNMILTRVRPSLYLPMWICIWSAISAATAAASNFSHLVTIRFLLGIAEAPFFPGAMYLMSCWYTRKAAVLNPGLVLATAFSGLIAAGIFEGIDGADRLSGWRWLFIICGSASFVIGLVSLLILPDYPDKASLMGRWLFTEEERKVAVLRILRDRGFKESHGQSLWLGVKAAVVDSRTWLFCLILVAQHTSYGFNYFFPTIVKGFHLGDTTITLVLTAPPYIFATAVSLGVAYSSDRLQDRGRHLITTMSTAAVGFIISASTRDTAALYFASFLYVSGCFSANALVYSWATSTLSQTPEKRAAAVAIINVLAQLGDIWSPYFFRPQDSPRYLLAMLLMMAFALLSVISCMVMRWLLLRANLKLLRQQSDDETDRVARPTLFTL